ncbi:hypothetical protein GQ53DRAFT_431262 [Thozetella sp. PMI_491]|nr:hypothetical protein GQ53DRAFT_431262 [Thozetella sp. PMI_491]
MGDRSARADLCTAYLVLVHAVLCHALVWGPWSLRHNALALKDCRVAPSVIARRAISAAPEPREESRLPWSSIHCIPSLQDTLSHECSTFVRYSVSAHTLCYLHPPSTSPKDCCGP